MRKRAAMIACVCLAIAWLVASFAIGPGCVVRLDPATLRQTNAPEYLLAGTDLVIWRRDETEIANPLLELLSRYRQTQTTGDTVPLEIAKFNPAWRDGHSPLYTVMVSDRTKWMTWTASHPELADFVWPMFLSHIESMDSGRAANLLFHAGLAETVDELQASLANDPEMQDGG